MNDLGALTYGVLGRALYLDTNVWSELAKGNLSPRSIDFLLDRSANYLILGPYQVMELSRRTDLAVGLDALFDRFPVCFAGHSEESELEGIRAGSVGYNFFHTMHTASPEIRKTWLEEFRSGIATRGWDVEGPALVAARKQEIERFRTAWPKSVRGPWRDHFWLSLDQYLLALCETAGHAYRADKLHNPDYYRGRKLHFTLLYQRHYLRQKNWTGSDWLDLLHGLEMAYASAAVVERSLKASLVDIRRDLPQIATPEPYSLSEIRSSAT